MRGKDSIGDIELIRMYQSMLSVSGELSRKSESPLTLEDEHDKEKVEAAHVKALLQRILTSDEHNLLDDIR